MDIISLNWDWMVFNLILASIGAGLGYVFLSTKQPFFKFIIFLVWILFLPNTIYLLTDLQHLPDQFYKIENEYKISLLLQYVFLLTFGIVSFVVGLWPMEKFISGGKGKYRKKVSFYTIILMNILIGIGVVLGKELRTHSWYVFTDYMRVVDDIKVFLNTPIYLIFALGFGVLGNLIYFAFNNKFAKYLRGRG